MLKSKNQIIATILCTVFFAQIAKAEFDIPESSIFVPHELGKVSLFHNKNGFCVTQNGQQYKVNKYDTDPILQNMPNKKLKEFLEHGYISINKMDNNDFAIRANVRGDGGGFLTANALYYVVKITGVVVKVGTTIFIPGPIITSTAPVFVDTATECVAQVAYNIGAGLPLP